MKRLIATLLAVAALAVPVLAQTGFSDVPADHLRSGDIQFVTNRGWMKGYPNDKFRPDQNITAEQMVAVLRRAWPEMTRSEFASLLAHGSAWQQGPAVPVASTTTTEPVTEPVTEPETTTTVAAATTTTTVPPLSADSPPIVGDPNWRPTISGIHIRETGGHGTDNDPNHRICVGWSVNTVGAPQILMTEWGTDRNPPYFYGRPNFQHWYEWTALVNGVWQTEDDLYWPTDNPQHTDYPSWGATHCAAFFEFHDPVQAVAIRAEVKPVVTDNVVKWALPDEFHALRQTTVHCQRITGAPWISFPPRPGGWATEACSGKLSARW